MKQIKIKNEYFEIKTSQTPRGTMIDICESNNTHSPIIVLTTLEFAYLLDAVSKFSKKVSKKNEAGNRNNKRMQS